MSKKRNKYIELYQGGGLSVFGTNPNYQPAQFAAQADVFTPGIVQAPNALDLSPYFQGANLAINRGQLQQGQQRLDLSREQLDLSKDEFAYRQQKDIMDYTLDLNNQMSSRFSSSVGSNMFGLDPLNSKQRAMISQANSLIQGVQEQGVASLLGASGGGQTNTQDFFSSYNELNKYLSSEDVLKAQAINGVKSQKYGIMSELAKKSTTDINYEVLDSLNTLELQYEQTGDLDLDEYSKLLSQVKINSEVANKNINDIVTATVDPKKFMELTTDHTTGTQQTRYRASQGDIDSMAQLSAEQILGDSNTRNFALNNNSWVKRVPEGVEATEDNPYIKGGYDYSGLVGYLKGEIGIRYGVDPNGGFDVLAQAKQLPGVTSITNAQGGVDIIPELSRNTDGSVTSLGQQALTRESGIRATTNADEQIRVIEAREKEEGVGKSSKTVGATFEFSDGRTAEVSKRGAEDAYKAIGASKDTVDKVISQVVNGMSDGDLSQEEVTKIIQDNRLSEDDRNSILDLQNSVEIKAKSAAPAESSVPNSPTTVKVDGVKDFTVYDGLTVAESNVLTRESSGGKYVVNPDDQGLATVGPGQFRGELGEKYLLEYYPELADKYGNIVAGQSVDAEGNPVKLTEAQAKDIENTIKSDPDYLSKSVAFAKSDYIPQMYERFDSVFNTNVSDPGIDVILESMAVQHGADGQSKIFKEAQRRLDSGESPDINTALTEARINYVKTGGKGGGTVFKDDANLTAREHLIRAEKRYREELDVAQNHDKISEGLPAKPRSQEELDAALDEYLKGIQGTSGSSAPQGQTQGQTQVGQAEEELSKTEKRELEQFRLEKQLAETQAERESLTNEVDPFGDKRQQLAERENELLSDIKKNNLALGFRQNVIEPLGLDQEIPEESFEGREQARIAGLVKDFEDLSAQDLEEGIRLSTPDRAINLDIEKRGSVYRVSYKPTPFSSRIEKDFGSKKEVKDYIKSIER